MKPILEYIIKPWRGIDVFVRFFASILPDKLYLSLLYRCRIGRWIDWNNPKTFTEKIQHLKLYNRKPEYTNMVDKYAVKKYVSDIIGEEYVIPTICIWNTVEEIDLDLLPNQFVLKTTHGGGGGGVIICLDKKTFDLSAAKRILDKSLNADIYKFYREWPYKNVPRRIIAEEFLNFGDDSSSIINSDNQIKDYKFFCFNGVPQFLKVDYDRFTNHHANYYDMEFSLLPFGEANLPPIENHIETCPQNFDEMVKIAEKLSSGHKFLRVDLYNIAGKIFFGELTFFPASGLGAFTSQEWDRKIGDMLYL